MSGSAVGHLEHEIHESRTATYLLVALILTALTAAEVWISYIPALLPVLVPMLLVLSGAKFALVALFYMHLHYDNWVFSGVFVPFLFLAAFVILVLLGLMMRYFSGF
ncbi:MAG TPA: cytochrome C oxidase subunit IV family protein [Candidatus Binataceae bacterium]|nr:cytochrome C oxidase subunit IV family protein [Candidatus Binataceae bacterium]